MKARPARPRSGVSRIASVTIFGRFSHFSSEFLAIDRPPDAFDLPSKQPGSYDQSAFRGKSPFDTPSPRARRSRAHERFRPRRGTRGTRVEGAPSRAPRRIG